MADADADADGARNGGAVFFCRSHCRRVVSPSSALGEDGDWPRLVVPDDGSKRGQEVGIGHLSSQGIDGSLFCFPSFFVVGE